MRSRRNSRLACTLIMAFAVAVAGCKKDDMPASQPAKPPQAGVKNALPVQKQSTSSKGSAAVQGQTSSHRRAVALGTGNDFSTKKDPFKPFAVEPVAPVTKTHAVARKADALPIQSYEVSKFRVSGIVAGLKENRALIIDPTGKGYVVKPGMSLGNNNGRIIKITNNALEVLEQFRDEKGVIRKRTMRLTLPQKSKEKAR